MTGNTTNRRTRTLAATALALLAAMLLAACGSSSNGSSTSSGSTAASKTAAAGGGSGAGSSSKGSSPGKTSSLGSRFDAFRECLKRQGITLPQRVPRKPGQGKPPAGSAVPFGFAGPKLPKGLSRSQYEAALKKCGGGNFRRRPGALGRLRNPAFSKSLTKFAECMRKAGVNVPNPNTSGSGPVFDTKGINTSSASFQKAEQKCAPLLRVGRPGGTGAPPGGAGGQPGAPPAEPGQ